MKDENRPARQDDEAARRAAATVWKFRARAELEAAARFARLAEELAALGAVKPVVALARYAASDELRHAQQCRALVRMLGSTPLEDEEAPSMPVVRSVAPGGVSPRERVLYEVVAMSCVTETLSAALLGEMIERATDTLVRETMQRILRDEVSHARLGWAHLAAEGRRGDVGVVGNYLPAMLAGTVQEELFSSWAEHPALEALSGLGALNRAERRRIFEETMRVVVFPGLRRFGVDTSRGEQWLADPSW